MTDRHSRHSRYGFRKSVAIVGLKVAIVDKIVKKMTLFKRFKSVGNPTN